jgi:patatin-like phospholipase/acyl hydrolase
MLSRPSPNKPLPVEARLFSPGRKRILTIDGGGVRGIVAIAFLKEMERELRQQHGKPDLVLADVFDMIAGTSVGSMLATMIALGKETAEIEAAFRDLAPKIFSGRLTLFGQKRFSAVPLVNGVRSFVKDATLGSDRLLTGLAIVAEARRHRLRMGDDQQPAHALLPRRPDWDGNRHYKLEMLIRASTAAPFLFTPTEITIIPTASATRRKGWFVDGACRRTTIRAAAC